MCFWLVTVSVLCASDNSPCLGVYAFLIVVHCSASTSPQKRFGTVTDISHVVVTMSHTGTWNIIVSQSTG